MDVRLGHRLRRPHAPLVAGNSGAARRAFCGHGARETVRAHEGLSDCGPRSLGTAHDAVGACRRHDWCLWISLSGVAEAMTSIGGACAGQSHTGDFLPTDLRAHLGLYARKKIRVREMRHTREQKRIGAS